MDSAVRLSSVPTEPSVGELVTPRPTDAQLAAMETRIIRALHEWHRDRANGNEEWWAPGEMKSVVHSLVEWAQSSQSVDHDSVVHQLAAIGTRAALSGQSASDVVAFLRHLESAFVEACTDAAHAGSVFGSLASFDFDATFDAVLAEYGNTRDELAGWYANAAPDLLGTLIFGPPPNADTISSYARLLQIDPRQPFRALALAMDEDAPARAWVGVRRDFARFLARYSPRRDYLVRESPGALLAIVPTEVSGLTPLDGFAELVSGVEARVYAATGEPANGLVKAGRSCRQAMSALDLALYRGHAGKVLQCTEVMIEVLLAHNRWFAQRLVVSRLKELVAEPHLLETLREYLRWNLDRKEAAKALHVHFNTVGYRLKQIEGILHADLTDFRTLHELAMALSALDVLTMQRKSADDAYDIRSLLFPCESVSY
jgi:hypothetical protein